MAARKNVSTAADLLGQLNQAVAPTKKKSTAKQRVELPLSADEQVSMDRWIKAKVVYDVVKTRTENAADELKELCLKLLAQRIFETKARPSNPEIKTTKDGGNTDSTALFQLTDRFKIKLPDLEDGSVRAYFVKQFRDKGLSQKIAE